MINNYWSNDFFKGEEASIVVISGLELVGSESGEYLEALQLAADWIVGSAGGPTDQVLTTQLNFVHYSFIVLHNLIVLTYLLFSNLINIEHV